MLCKNAGRFWSLWGFLGDISILEGYINLYDVFSVESLCRHLGRDRILILTLSMSLNDQDEFLAIQNG